jgi:hypothetical protein
MNDDDDPTDALARGVLEPEIVDTEAAGSVRVLALTNPFTMTRLERFVPEGATLAEIRGGIRSAHPPGRSSWPRRSSRHSTFLRSYRLSDDEAVSWVSIAMPQCNRYIALRSPLQREEACSELNRGLGASLARGDAPRHAFTDGNASCRNLAADRMRPSEATRTRSLPQGIAREVISTRDRQRAESHASQTGGVTTG